MNEKIMQVFYGTDCLPYKDQARSVHYPIVGNSFLGASNTTKIRFYIDQIGDISDTWVANTKLPNGKMGNQLLTTKSYETINNVVEHYVELSLSSFYTQAKGDIYISLNGFYGEVTITEEEGTPTISGVPTIQATGAVKIAINYATPLLGSDEVDTITLAQVLDYIGTKLDKNDPRYIKVIDSTANLNTSTYEDFVQSGDIVFAKSQGSFYLIGGEYPTLTTTDVSPYFASFTAIVGLIGELTVGGLLKVDFDKIKNTSNVTLQSVLTSLDNAITAIQANYVTTNTQQTISGSKTFANTTYFGSYIEWQDGAYLFEQNFGLEIVGGGSDSKSLHLENNSTSGGAYVYLDDDNIVTISGENGVDLVSQTEVSITSPDIRFHFGGTYSVYFATSLSQNETIAYQSYVQSQIASALGSTYRPQGTKTVAELNALTPTSAYNGYVYNVSDSGTLTQGSVSVNAGDNVAIIWDNENNTWSWDKLAGFIDLSGYVTTSALTSTLAGYVKTTRTIAGIALSSDISASDLTTALGLDNVEKTTNKVTSISSASTDTQYPTAKCVYDAIDTVEGQIPTEWYGTQTQYDNLSTYDINTTYYILEN